MKTNQINLTSDNTLKFTIQVAKNPLIIRIILGVVMSMLFLIPLAMTGYVIMNDMEIKAGVFVLYLILWGMGIYLFRIIIWNVYGKEVFIINNDHILYYADYRFFKDGARTLKTGALQYSIEEIANDNRNLGYLLIIGNDDEQIESSIKVPVDELYQLISNLNSELDQASKFP